LDGEDRDEQEHGDATEEKYSVPDTTTSLHALIVPVQNAPVRRSESAPPELHLQPL
jgi:hypothetical protein